MSLAIAKHDEFVDEFKVVDQLELMDLENTK
jgi:hypothetical protein